MKQTSYVVICFSFIAFFLFPSSAESQTAITLNPSSTNTWIRYINTSYQYDYTKPSSPAATVGRKNGSNGINVTSTEDIYVTNMTFNLSSLSGRTITNATFIVRTPLGYVVPDYKFRITPLSSINSNGADAVNDISTSYNSPYFSDIPNNVASGETGASFTSEDLTSAVSNALSSGYLYIGLISQNNSSNNTYVTVTVQLKVTCLPAITIKNSFNGGRLIVDNDTVNSGSIYNWIPASPHTLKAFTQDVSGIHYQLKSSNMWKNITTNQPFNQNPLPVNITADATYEAQFDLPSHKVMVDQTLSNNTTRLGTIGRWNGTSFPSSRLNPGDSITVVQDASEILQGYQEISTGQKYRVWKRNTVEEPNVVNHHSFVIQANDANYTSQFQPTNNATVQTQAIEGGNPTGGVNFKDPWLIDYADPSYGNNLRNQGMSAPLKSVAYSANNLGTGTSYKGVFLNQNPDQQDTNKPYYTVRAPQTINFGGAIGVRNVYLQSWRAIPQASASFQDSLASQTAVVFKSSNAVVSANVKGSMLSNTATAFSNNSQRKLVRTKDGGLHQVYESMGRVWLEHSTDQGTTWFLGNGGQPLDNGSGKCPSIDWHYNNEDPNNTSNYAVIVVYQQPSGGTYTIEYAVFIYTNGSYVRQGQNFAGPLYAEPAGGDQYASTNANPNIAWGVSYRFGLIFERKSTAGGMQPGIYWRYGSMHETGVEPANNYSALTLVSGTTSSSTNAIVSMNKQRSDDMSIFHIVYQESNSTMKEVQLCCLYNGGISWSPSQTYLPVVISTGSAAMYNYKPSMVEMPNGDCRVCWIRDLYGMGSLTPQYVNVVYLSSLWASAVNIYGNMANSVSLNIKDATSNTYFAYAQKYNNSTWQNLASNGSSTISLSTTGQHIQLSNGSSSSAMYASSFYPSSFPYYFQTTGSLGGLAKSSGDEYTYGRGIALNGLGFFYSLKSLTVDKSNIRFAEIPERNDATTRRTKMQYLTLDSLNTMLISEPFTVGEGTSFTFSDDGGFTDSSAVKEVLGKKGYISCKLELIDDATGKTLGVMKESKFSLSSSFRDNLSASCMNLKGMGTKNVRVKITVSSNVDSLNGVWVNEYGTMDDNTLAKIAKDDITLQSPEIITEYALEQNYPNPFNPSTTIHYQLPNAGHVTLKVYDMLGREVAILVDEKKETGSYSATFDGARLASGTYIARLTAQSKEGKSIVQTKKMLMLK